MYYFLTKGTFWREFSNVVLSEEVMSKTSPRVISSKEVKNLQNETFCRCSSFQGDGPLYPVAGMMNAETYSEVVRQNVVREMLRHFQLERYFSSKDLASCHSAKT